MKKFCAVNAPPEIAEPTPAHKVLPGTVEIETSDPNSVPVNPVEPAEVTPVRNRRKPKKTIPPNG